jgi:hypothetical protein
MKKGQSAVEYLLAYGWAFLAIAIIAALFWVFVHPSTGLSEAQEFINTTFGNCVRDSSLDYNSLSCTVNYAYYTTSCQISCVKNGEYWDCVERDCKNNFVIPVNKTK